MASESIIQAAVVIGGRAACFGISSDILRACAVDIPAPNPWRSMPNCSRPGLGVCLSSQGLTLPRHSMSSRAGRCRRGAGQEDRLPSHQYTGGDGGGEAVVACYFFSARSNECSACSSRSKTRRPGLLRRMGLSSSQRMLSRRSFATRRALVRRLRPLKAGLSELSLFVMAFCRYSLGSIDVE